MLLLDLSHTSHTQARTGIQRVCRNLHAALGAEAAAVTWDPYAACWRPLGSAENACAVLPGHGPPACAVAGSTSRDPRHRACLPLRA